MAGESGYLKINFDTNVNSVESPNGTYTYSGQVISTDGESGSLDGIWFGAFKVNCEEGYVIDSVTIDDDDYYISNITDTTFYAGSHNYSSFNSGSPTITITTKAPQASPYEAERLYRDSKIQGTKTVTENGTVVPDEGYEAIKEVIVNVPSNNFGETWVIDGYTGYLQSLSDMTVYFVSNGELFFGFRCTQDDGAPDGTYDCVNYVKPNGTLLYVGLNCVNSTYKKITLFEPASGDLLTYLQKCATKQA